MRAYSDFKAPNVAIVAGPFTIQGTVSTVTGLARWYNDTGRTLTIESVRISTGANVSGSTLIVDVNKDGTTIFTTQGNRPSIASGASAAKVTNMDVTTIADGSYFTIDVDQVGTAANLVVNINLR